jgi:hypothetical protein
MFREASCRWCLYGLGMVTVSYEIDSSEVCSEDAVIRNRHTLYVTAMRE